MNFIEAHRIVRSAKGGRPLPFLFAMSGTAAAFDIFFKAAAARVGRVAHVRTLSFNTLAQAIATPPAAGEVEIFLLFPWDLVPALDWRTGIVATLDGVENSTSEAQRRLDRIARRPAARLLYVPAPAPPLFPNPTEDAQLTSELLSRARTAGARVLPSDVFALGGYLSSGSPVAGTHLGEVAKAVVAAAGVSDSPRKVLVTDLDNVLWRGTIAEDGVEGIVYRSEGVGYRHFLYQTMLKKLKSDGVILAAVSRNKLDDALIPLRTGSLVLVENDFVCLIAGYGAKSAQIAQISERLNLGLESFVFVDDNPIELAEVALALPEVECIRFPIDDDALPAMFEQLALLFARTRVTAEDRQRTELYRRRLEGIVASERAGGDITEFLQELDMELTIHDRTQSDRTRAIQLINKTNQFNLNGRRFTDAEVAHVIAAGGRLLTATLDDRTGSHGEILVCLIDDCGVIEALVLSCRVFQRRVEHAFLAWLVVRDFPLRGLRFTVTDRNEPLRRFLAEVSLPYDCDGLITLDPTRLSVQTEALSLFRIRER